MWKSFSPPREAPTTIPCRECGRLLAARRSCREARLGCPGCGRSFELREYIERMDEALEKFLEALNCDRI